MATTQRFPMFDACRALAALSVLAYHIGMIGGHSTPISDALVVGVPVFFAISGFLLYRPFAAARATGRTVSLRRYATRRVLRIVPAYWVALTGLAVVFSWPVFDGDAWRYYGFAQIYTTGSFDGGLAVAWTLCIEVTFYVLLPAYAFAARRLTWRAELAVLAGLGVLSGVVHAGFYPSASTEATPALTLAGTFMWFVPGMLLAVWTVHRPVTGAGRYWAGAVVAFAALVALRESGLPGWVPAVTATPLFALLLLLPAANLTAAGSIPHRVLSTAVLAWLGTISYGLYLYHATVIAWLDGRPLTEHWPVLAAAALGLSVIVAAGSWYLIERPALRLARGRATGARRAQPGFVPARQPAGQ